MRVAIVAYATTRRSLEALLACLFALDRVYLETHTEVPRLRDSGVFYSQEPAALREERWNAINVVRHLGWGDCDDLAVWRAAELRVRDGIDARPELVEQAPGSWHVVVRLPDGSTDDPCAGLGMYRSRLSNGGA